VKTSISPKDSKGLKVNLESLRTLKPDDLAEWWRSLFGSDPPARLRRPLLIQALAYRLQEKAFGGLKPATQRLLASVAGDASAGRSTVMQPRRSFKAGAVLVREWHGTRYQVTVLKDGFVFGGKPFRSLSEIAREITGTRWSGPVFFGLKNSREE
jgi:Protein of unknown function (DUF2924)